VFAIGAQAPECSSQRRESAKDCGVREWNWRAAACRVSGENMWTTDSASKDRARAATRARRLELFVAGDGALPAKVGERPDLRETVAPAPKSVSALKGEHAAAEAPPAPRAAVRRSLERLDVARSTGRRTQEGDRTAKPGRA